MKVATKYLTTPCSKSNVYSIKSNPIAFKGNYSSMSDDIKVREETVNEPISSMSGDVKVKKSKANAGISTMSGDIDVSDSHVKGTVKTMSGDVDISDSTLNGNITTKSGDITADASKITGDMETKAGKIKLINSEVDGEIRTFVDSLKLEGKNTLRDLIFGETNGGGSNVIISGGSNVVISGGSNQSVSIINGVVTINGKRINPNELGKEAESIVPEFRLPKGNKITGLLKFESKKPGVLMLEKGAEFVGILINGAIRHIK